MRLSRRDPRLGALGAVLVLVLTSGCALDGVRFTESHGVDIVAPSDGALVQIPFEVRVSGAGAAERLGVFVDTPPMAPGRTLLSLVPSDDPCRLQVGCPDAAWLAQ